MSPFDLLQEEALMGLDRACTSGRFPADALKAIRDGNYEFFWTLSLGESMGHKWGWDGTLLLDGALLLDYHRRVRWAEMNRPDSGLLRGRWGWTIDPYSKWASEERRAISAMRGMAENGKPKTP